MTLRMNGHEVQIRRSQRGYAAQATVRTRFGDAVITADVPRALVAAATAGLGQAMSSGADVDVFGSGFDFGDIGKAIGAATKSKEFGQATGIIGAVAKNPMFQGLAAAAIGPAAGPALQGIGAAADAASTLAANARKKDPKAIRAVKHIGERARAGDPRAQRMAGLVAAAIDLHGQAERAAAAVSPAPAPAPSYGAMHFPAARPVPDGPYDDMAARYAAAAQGYTLAPQGDGSWGLPVSSGGIAL